MPHPDHELICSCDTLGEAFPSRVGITGQFLSDREIGRIRAWSRVLCTGERHRAAI